MCDTLLSKYEVTYKNSKFRRFLYADRNREQEYIKKEGDFFFFFLGRLPRTCMHVFIEKINLPCEERLSAFSIPQIRAPEKTLHPRWSIDVPILRDPIRSSSSPSSSSTPLARALASESANPLISLWGWRQLPCSILVHYFVAGAGVNASLLYDRHACRHQIRSVYNITFAKIFDAAYVLPKIIPDLKSRFRYAVRVRIPC